MPKISGIKLIQTILELKIAPPLIILLTAIDEQDATLAEKLKSSPQIKVIRKPYFQDELLKEVTSFQSQRFK